MMPGVTFEAITDAIEEAYDQPELAKVLRARMDTRLDLITAPGTFSYVVFELLSWAERNGREAELVRVVAQAKPTQPKLQRVYKQYGMAIPLRVRKQGLGVLAAPKDVTDSGLQELVREYNSLINLTRWRERLTEIEGQVCRILFNGNSAGTGFLVGPQVVMTARHVLTPVIAGQTPAAHVGFQFDYKELKDGSRSSSPIYRLDHPEGRGWLLDESPPTLAEADNQPLAGAPLPTNDQLDYVIVRLADPVGDRPTVPHPGSSARAANGSASPA